jgi:hypothetical protein
MQKNYQLKQATTAIKQQQTNQQWVIPTTIPLFQQTIFHKASVARTAVSLYMMWHQLS